MTVLIAFATVEGQTGKIARFVEKEAQALGHETLLVDVCNDDVESFDGIDAVILAASVHERRHPRGFEMWVAANAEELARRPTLMLSVSLSAAFPEGMEDARDYLEEMKMRTGLKPADEMCVAGAVRTGKYDFFAAQVVRYVVLRDRPYDPDQGEHEFTDWDALARKVREFLGQKA